MDICEVDGASIEMYDSTDTQEQGLQNFERSVNEAYSVGQQFSKYYYDMLERRPHLVGQLYVENSVMIWDGNPIVGRDAIQTFVEQMPSLTFNLSSMDCQAVNSLAVGSSKSFIIKVSGQYRASGLGIVRPFIQQLIVIPDQSKWRIASDVMRCQE